VDTTSGGGHISNRMKSYKDIKVNILEQTSSKSVVFTFGRFQPPTSGHQLLINKVIKEASKLRAEHRIYPSHSQDSKQNPLSHKDKVLYMRKMFPKADIVDDKKAKTPYHVLESLSKEGYKKVYFIVGGDRVSEFKNGMKKYVGKDGYDFDVFEVLSAGRRDPDAEGVVGMSGSKMRKAAQDNDFEKFTTGVPDKTPKRVAQGLFKAIRKGMGLKESYMREDLIPPRRGGYAHDGTGAWGLGEFDFNIPDPIQYLDPSYRTNPMNYTSYWVDYPVEKFEEDSEGGTWYRWARDDTGYIRGFTYTSQGDEDTPEKEITIPWPPPDWDMPGHLPEPKYRDIPGLYEANLLKKLKKKLKMDKFSRSERKRKKKNTKKIRRYNKMVGIPLTSSYDAELNEGIRDFKVGDKVKWVGEDEYEGDIESKNLIGQIGIIKTIKKFGRFHKGDIKFRKKLVKGAVLELDVIKESVELDEWGTSYDQDAYYAANKKKWEKEANAKTRKQWKDAMKKNKKKKKKK